MVFDSEGNRKYLTPGERDAFLAEARCQEPETDLLCQTLAFTGARITEVLMLSPMKIDIGNQTVVIECLKRRKRAIFRGVPVPFELIEALDETFSIAERQKSPELRKRRMWQICRTTAYLKVKSIMRKSGVPPALCMPKSLRHTFGVTGTAIAGIPLSTMQKWMGHSKIETTAIYANAVGPEERALMDRMWSVTKLANKTQEQHQGKSTTD